MHVRIYVCGATAAAAAHMYAYSYACRRARAPAPVIACGFERLQLPSNLQHVVVMATAGATESISSRHTVDAEHSRRNRMAGAMAQVLPACEEMVGGLRTDFSGLVHKLEDKYMHRISELERFVQDIHA